MSRNPTLERVCRLARIPDELMDDAVEMCAELIEVEAMVTGGANKLAVARALNADAEFEPALRAGFQLAGLNAQVALEARMRRRGMRPRDTDQLAMAMAEGVSKGVELAIAAQRVAARRAGS